MVTSNPSAWDNVTKALAEHDVPTSSLTDRDVLIMREAYKQGLRDVSAMRRVPAIGSGLEVDDYTCRALYEAKTCGEEVPLWSELSHWQRADWHNVARTARSMLDAKAAALGAELECWADFHAVEVPGVDADSFLRAAARHFPNATIAQLQKAWDMHVKRVCERLFPALALP